MRPADDTRARRHRVQGIINQAVQSVGPQMKGAVEAHLQSALGEEYDVAVVLITSVPHDPRLEGNPTALYSDEDQLQLCEILAVTLKGMRATLSPAMLAELDRRLNEAVLGQVRLNNQMVIDRDPPRSDVVH